MRDYRDAKAMARTLREAMAAKAVKIGNGEALELVARMLGQRDWNTLAAAIDDARRRDAVWSRLEALHARREPVSGAITGRVRGGLTVDLGDATAFLPGTQVDTHPGWLRDLDALMGRQQPFAILKLDRRGESIVVSRRAMLEATA